MLEMMKYPLLLLRYPHLSAIFENDPVIPSVNDDVDCVNPSGFWKTFWATASGIATWQTKKNADFLVTVNVNTFFAPYVFFLKLFSSLDDGSANVNRIRVHVVQWPCLIQIVSL